MRFFKALTIFAALSVFTGAALAAERSERARRALQIIEEHKNNIIIIDVRTPEEFKEGHLKGAKNIPLNELPWLMDTLDKDKQILLYCRSGRRSHKAESILTEAGFVYLFNAGGLADIQKEQARQEKED